MLRCHLGAAWRLSRAYDCGRSPIQPARPVVFDALLAGALCASSLAAGAFVVMTRWPQKRSPHFRGRIAAATVWVSSITIRRHDVPRAYRTPLRLAQRIAGCCRCCRWGSGVGLSHATAGEPDCDRALVDGCGRTARVALTLSAGLHVSPCLRLPAFRR